MSVADARGLCGDGPRTVEHDPAADATALESLARWCHRFSPVVARDGDDRLLLDVTGCPHLHGGERPMLRTMREALAARRLDGRLALADTPALARAVAGFGRGTKTVVPSGTGLAAARRLPVESLRLAPATVVALRELGVTTVGQLDRLPRSTLPARFGSEIAHRLDEVAGRRPETVTPVRPLERLRVGRSFEPPVVGREQVEHVVGRFLGQLLERLRARREGVVRLTILLQAESDTTTLEVGCARSIDSPDRLRRLVGLRLERTDLPSEVSRVSMEVAERALLGWRRQTLFAEDEHASEFDDLVERLSLRLGERSVLRPELVADAQPERAFRWRSALEDVDRSAEPAVGLVPGRPFALLARPRRLAVVEDDDGRPERFEAQGRTHVVGRVWGPERIGTGWWREPSVRRDYFRVETTTGHRFWLYRTPSGAWFLHGNFD